MIARAHKRTLALDMGDNEMGRLNFIINAIRREAASLIRDGRNANIHDLPPSFNTLRKRPLVPVLSPYLARAVPFFSLASVCLPAQRVVTAHLSILSIRTGTPFSAALPLNSSRD